MSQKNAVDEISDTTDDRNRVEFVIGWWHTFPSGILVKRQWRRRPKDLVVLTY